MRAYVKGAPDVLLARSTHGINPRGEVVELTDELRAKVMQGNDYLASQGMRVLAFAGKGFDPHSFDPRCRPAGRNEGAGAVRPGGNRRPTASGSQSGHR